MKRKNIDNNNFFLLSNLKSLRRNKIFYKEAFLVLIFQAQNVIGLLFQLKIFSNVLGLNNFGKLNVFNSVSILILSCFSFSIASAFARLYLIAKKNNTELKMIISIIQIAFIVIIINLFYSLIGLYTFNFDENKYALILLLFLFTSLKSAQEVFRQIFSIERKRLKLILLDFTYYVVVFLLIFSYQNADSIGILNIILFQIAGLFSSLVYSFKSLKITSKKIINFFRESFNKIQFVEIKNIFKLTLPISVLSLSAWIQTSVSKLVLNNQLLFEDIGKLSILQQVYFGPTILLISILITLSYPIMNSNLDLNFYGELTKKDKIYIRRIFSLISIAFFISFGVLVIFYNIFNVNILNFFDLNFSKENYFLINVILISAFFQGATQILSAFSLSILKVRFFSERVAPFTIIFGIPLIYFLTSTYGIQGALISKLTIIFIIFLLNWFNLFKYI